MLILCVSVSGFPDPSTQHVYMYIFSMHFTIVFIGNEYVYDAQESNLPVYYVVQTHYTCTASVCIKSKFHNGSFKLENPVRSKQVTEWWYAVMQVSQVTPSNLCLPHSEATNTCQTTEAHIFLKFTLQKKHWSPIAGLGSWSIIALTQQNWHVFNILQNS